MKYYFPLSILVIIVMTILLATKTKDSRDYKHAKEQLLNERDSILNMVERINAEKVAKEDTLVMVFQLLENQKIETEAANKRAIQAERKRLSVKFVSLESDSARTKELKELYPSLNK